MPSLTTEHDLQRARRHLRICYLCSRPLNDGRDTNRDHAPPRSLFLAEDHRSPLILETHKVCNQARSDRDEIVGQLFHFLHGRSLDVSRDRRGLEAIPDAHGQLHTVLPARHLFFSGEIDRWMRACHATLYGKPFSSQSVKRNLHPPLPTGRLEDRRIIFEAALPQHAKFAEVIRRNRLSGNLDRIEAWNGRFIYECVWVVSDDGRWLCMWAMRVYDWERLGEGWPTERRGCTGFYWLPEGRPREATVGTALQFPVSSSHPLDPFAVVP